MNIDSVDETPVQNKRLRTEEGILLSEEQTNAVRNLLSRSHGCLVGSAGTGKTTTANELIKGLFRQESRQDKLISLMDTVDIDRRTKLAEIRDLNEYYMTECSDVIDTGNVDSLGLVLIPPVALCSPTAKASIRLSQSVPKQFRLSCKTIHMLLGYHNVKIEKEVTKNIGGVDVKSIELKNEWVPYFNKFNKMPWKVIVIDEASMVGERLLAELMEACLPEARIYLIGDLQQLPPPMDRASLPLAMHTWGFQRLSKVFRTEHDSIINLANDILEGKDITKYDSTVTKIVKLEDFGIKLYDSTPVRAFVEGQLLGAHKQGFFDPFTDFLLLPQAKGNVGSKVLNDSLAQMFNPGERTPVTSNVTSFNLRVDDRIMITENWYGKGVINGSLCTVVAIDKNMMSRIRQTKNMSSDFSSTISHLTSDENDMDRTHQASHVISLKADSGANLSICTAGEYAAVLMGYALTCHKAQGSEARNVFVVISRHHNAAMLNCEWLYTAVTRAVEKVCIITDGPSLNRCLRNKFLPGNTYQEKIDGYMSKRKTSFTGTDLELPEAVDLNPNEYEVLV